MSATIRNLTVSFGLVEFPASLKKASEKKDVTFDSAIKVVEGKGKQQRVTYERVRQVKTGARSGVYATSSATGTSSAMTVGTGAMAPTEIVKGVWVAEDEFRPLPEGALDAIMEAGQIDGIAIEEFVPLKSVPWHRVEGAYYLTPQKGLIGAKPMRLLRDALKAEKAAGVAKLCLKGTGGRQKLAVIHEANGMLVVNLLAFAVDFREADESAAAIENVAVDRKMLTLARAMVRERTQPTSVLLDEAVDSTVAERENLYVALFDGDGYEAPVTQEPTAPRVDDLMAALQASLEAAR